jgi:hypothetical protein
MYARFVSGLPGFFRHRITLDQARDTIRCRLRVREEAFLSLVSTSVYGQRSSPYLALLRRAGCELGDLTDLVRNDGLESALARLHAEGVCVSFEEFKGRVPIVRNGLQLNTTADDFDNPTLSRAYERQSGGTTGRGTRVRVDLDHISATVAHMMLLMDAHGVTGLPNVMWHGVLPDAIAINEMLRGAQAGILTERWFTPVRPSDARAPARSRLAGHAIVMASRIMGVPFPRPEYVPCDSADVVARWAGDTLRSRGPCVVRTMVSQAVRVALAAADMKVDLTGVVFMVLGEPPTPAKVAAIRSVGARHAPGYAFSEFGGRVGIGCANPADENDQHLLTDAGAMIQVDTQVPGTSLTVPAFCVTGLLPTSPKILINVGTDDYGTLETRSCGCPLEELGLTKHVRHIRSFGKLTGEGVTLIGTEMVRVLEEVLPARFGGGPLDYQLAEEEDARGFTRITLRISPRIAPRPDEEMIAAVLDAIGAGGVAAAMTRALWQKAGTLRIERREPVWTTRGKMLPLDLTRRLTRTCVTAGEESRAR